VKLVQILIHLLIFLSATSSIQIYSAKQKENSDVSRPSTYRVQAGDTWWSIAKKFETKPADLASWNGRSDKEALYQNELLKISATKFTNDEMKAIKPSLKPSFPLPAPEKIQKSYSEITHTPQKGVEFGRENSGYVLSTLPGKVVNIDYMDGYENYVILEHQNGWFSIYGNLERVQVIEGQMIQAKDRIGTLVRKKGLYFQVNQNKNTVNPALFLQQGS